MTPVLGSTWVRPDIPLTTDHDRNSGCKAEIRTKNGDPAQTNVRDRQAVNEVSKLPPLTTILAHQLKPAGKKGWHDTNGRLLHPAP